MLFRTGIYISKDTTDHAILQLTLFLAKL